MRKVNKKITGQDRIMKTLIVILCYFLYSRIFSELFGYNILTNFIADAIYLIGIILAYKENLREDYYDLRENYTVGKIIKKVLFWFMIIFIFNILMGALTDALIKNASLDDNTKALENLFKVSPGYALFKTMIFAVVAEELLFRESVHDVIKNKWLFIFASALIYTLVNFAYTGFNDEILIISMLSYFLPALIFSYAYYKNNSNIIIIMLIKFVCNLLPTVIFFLGL